MSIGFDQPGAWGFCKYCAFQVAVDLETGKMLAHERRNGGWAFVRCYGSLMEPTEQPAPDAMPVKWEQEFVDALSEEGEAAEDAAAD